MPKDKVIVPDRGEPWVADSNCIRNRFRVRIERDPELMNHAIKCVNAFDGYLPYKLSELIEAAETVAKRQTVDPDIKALVEALAAFKGETK